MENRDIYLVVYAAFLATWFGVGIYLAANYDRFFGKGKMKRQDR
jgi:hypothetical protein